MRFYQRKWLHRIRKYHYITIFGYYNPYIQLDIMGYFPWGEHTHTHPFRDQKNQPAETSGRMIHLNGRWASVSVSYLTRGFKRINISGLG